MGNSKSQSRDTTEEDRIERERIATEQARIAAEAERLQYEMMRSLFVNERDSSYVQILGNIYSSNKNNQTPENLASYKQAQEVDEIASTITQSNIDEDIYKIINKTSIMLNDVDKQNSTKVYFMSEVIIKAFGHFYEYNKKNNETQYNYLLNTFPKTFKDDEYVENKYKKFISLIALANVSKNITSSSLSPNSEYFIAISKPIINESKKIIDEFLKINYNNIEITPLTDGEKKINPANNDEQEKYKIIVI